MILKTQTPNPFFSIRIYEGEREIGIIAYYTQVECEQKKRSGRRGAACEFK